MIIIFITSYFILIIDYIYRIFSNYKLKLLEIFITLYSKIILIDY